MTVHGQDTYPATNFNFSFAEAVAFDPTGAGRRDHIAFTGLCRLPSGAMKIVVWVLNTQTDELSTLYQAADASWMASALMQSVFDLYQAPNFFSITAGDYDGDGRDSLVVYTCGDGTPGTVELVYDSSTLQFSQFGSRRTDTMNALYMKSVATWTDPAFKTYRWKLGADLTSGDFNGDGIDDLAVISYTNRIDNDDYYAELYKPYLAVLYGREGYSVSNAGKARFQYLSNGSLTMAAPSIASGDIDGDGLPELVMVGYYATITGSGSACGRSISDDEFLYAAYLGADDAGTMGAPTFLAVDITASIRDKADEGDNAHAPIEVACAAVDGPGSPEAVMIGHSLYSISGLEATRLATLEDVPLSELADPVTGKKLTLRNMGSRNVVSSVAVGCFDGNNLGREQVILTVAFRTGSSQYSYCNFFMGRSQGADGEPGKFVAKFSLEKDLEKQSSSLLSGLNYIAIAADCDEDGIMARYSRSDWFYANPDVTAVLQAAPWFGELGAWGDFQGGTSYGYSQSYSFGTSSTKSVSFGVGIKKSVSTLLAKFSAELGYTADWSRSFEREQTREYETTFTAGPRDIVVLTRTPVYRYAYDIYDETTGTWLDEAVHISVPQKPLVYRLTIEEYNAYADAYNAALAAQGNTAKDVPRLAAIGDPHLEQEGNPYGYYNAAGSSAGLTPLSDFYTLGHAGATASFSLSEGGSQTISEETTHGLHFEAEVSGGLLGHAGVYTELDYANGSGSFRSSGSALTTACSVVDLNDTEQPGSAGYDFKWQFCTWDLTLGATRSPSTAICSKTCARRRPRSPA